MVVVEYFFLKFYKLYFLVLVVLNIAVVVVKTVFLESLIKAEVQVDFSI